MRASLLLPVLLALPFPAAATELLVLTRDGVLHRVEEGKETPLPGSFTQPRALATLSGGRVVVAHGDRLTILEKGRPRVLAGGQEELLRFAADDQLYAASGKELFAVDLKTGKRNSVMRFSRLGLVAAHAGGLCVEHDGVLEQLLPQPRRTYRLDGHPVALAATAEKLFVATREGPLWEIDRGSGKARDLGMGGWWGTVALTSDGKKLYAITHAGKLWEIDPAAGTKTIISMSGWESAIALAVAR